MAQSGHTGHEHEGGRYGPAGSMEFFQSVYMHWFLSPIESNKRQLFCGEKKLVPQGEYFLRYLNNKISKLLKITIFFVQNRLFYYPEFIWSFLSCYIGLILSLKNPQRPLYYFEFESISMVLIHLQRAAFEFQRKIKRLAQHH